MTGGCDAWADGRTQPTLHTCDDPLACALEHLEKPEAVRLHELLDRIEEACQVSKAKVAQAVLTMIHSERGGPR